MQRVFVASVKNKEAGEGRKNPGTCAVHSVATSQVESLNIYNTARLKWHE